MGTAAERDGAEAMYLLAMRYLDGGDLVQSDQRAYRWRRNAAKAGHVKAQLQTASAHLHGEFVARDIDLAEKWYRRAAESGDLTGQVELARILARRYVVTGDDPDRETEKW
jgi:TPR repeat protein